jgi:uncharacterized repeat protein (TIGR01451 family)
MKRSVVIVVRVQPGTRGILHNDAHTYGSHADLYNANNYAHTDTQVDALAVLTIAKADYPDPVIAGTILTYEVTITNTGPSSATGVTLTDSLPVGVAYQGYTVSNGTGTCSLLPDKLYCDLNNLPVGGYVKVIFTVLVNPSVPHNTVLWNSATADAVEAAPVTVNQDTKVNAQADLVILKDANFLTVNPAPRIKYTVTVTNQGPSDALSVVMTDKLPLDPKKIIYVMDSGNGLCSYLKASPHKVVCNFGVLPAGQTVSVDIIIDVRGSVKVISNIATVTTTTFDPNTANNTVRKDVRIKGGPGTGSASLEALTRDETFASFRR